MTSSKVGGEEVREARSGRCGLLLLLLCLLQIRHTLALPAHADARHDERANEVHVGGGGQNPEQNGHYAAPLDAPIAAVHLREA